MLGDELKEKNGALYDEDGNILGFTEWERALRSYIEGLVTWNVVDSKDVVKAVVKTATAVINKVFERVNRKKDEVTVTVQDDGKVVLFRPIRLRTKDEYLPEHKDKILKMVNDWAGENGPVKDPKLREIFDNVLVFLSLATSDTP